MLRLVFLVVAFLAAGAAAWFAYGMLQPPVQVVQIEAPAAPPPTEVLVAAVEIGMGERVTPEAFAWRPWPETMTQDGYVLRTARPAAIEELAGSLARNRFVAGEPILPQKLVSGDSGLLAAVLGPGERAMAVRVSAESAAGGFVLPGDRVDVLLTRLAAGPDGREYTTSAAILRNIEVLAIDQAAVETKGDAVVGKTATLRLSAAQAETLAAAELNGKLSLTLRAAADRSVTDAPPEPEPGPSALASESPPPEPDPTVRVRRAGVPEIVSLP